MLNGVSIVVEGDEDSISKFRNEIVLNAPPASLIRSVVATQEEIRNFAGFMIAGSSVMGTEITEICPDIAVCPDCLDDIKNDASRIDYPFTNCTACGPRFTIIESLPYDRCNTSMREFPMCSSCSNEYNDVSDRRFHAQPVACNSCGPVYTYYDSDGHINGIAEILDRLSVRITTSQSVAIKGMGGYHLACDALDNNAVRVLRERKQRDAKPFAVMFRDIISVQDYCHVTPEEFRELTSWRRPVVILREKRTLAPAVNNGLGTTGAFLPYLPIHYLLFSRLETPALVMTSGNISEDPLIKDDREASEKLFEITGAVVSHNRNIVNRTDDSVIRVSGRRVNIIRRARGYVPSPVDVNFDVSGMLAAGPEQKNTFCIGKERQAILSQHIGDLKNLATYDFYCEAINRFRSIFRFEPVALACDLHPDYLSTMHAEKLKEELGLKLVRVQHHHAHIASVMAENMIDEKIIGVCLDGTGYGTDGNIWGGEFLVADYNDFQRFAHFDYLPVPGGDRAVDEPWRMAYSFLYKYFGEPGMISSLPAFAKIDAKELLTVKRMIDENINSPLSCGAGRLFDAVSAILNICPVSGFDSEAPVRLENAIMTETDEFYPYETGERIIFKKTIGSILNDLGRSDISLISARFHNSVVMAIVETCMEIRKKTGLNKVALSGGVFQNSYILGRTCILLKKNKFDIYTNQLVPANDGGVSLGQLVIAAKTFERCA